ncbi:MAG: nitroreductase family protein [Pseudomonadales bacterium]|jgi:nitroreductase
MDVLEAMNSCIAMRYLKPDPLPRETVRTLVHAATRASSPGNSQGWEFVIIDNLDLKSEFGEAVSAAMAPVFANRPRNLPGPLERMYQGAEHLASHFAAVPVWILGCGRRVYPPQAPQDVFMYSTVYPAAQNLIVAARSMGIGTAFTTFHMTIEALLRERLGLPADVIPCVMIAAGYPARPFSAVRRRKTEEVMHWNGW